MRGMFTPSACGQPSALLPALWKIKHQRQDPAPRHAFFFLQRALGRHKRESCCAWRATALSFVLAIRLRGVAIIDIVILGFLKVIYLQVMQSESIQVLQAASNGVVREV